jgi:hypothetical protein
LLDGLNPTIAKLNLAIEQEAEKCPQARLLMTHPGVGALTALAFVLIIGEAERFQCGKWLNPNAPANCLADVAKWRENLGVTYEHLPYEMGFWNEEGSSAYAVISGALTVTIKGQSVVRTGTPAYTFAKRDGVWKIEAQAWGRTS